MKLIDKNKLLEELKKLKQNLSVSPIVVIEDVESLVESFEVKEVGVWHLQKNEDIYDAVNDWSLHSFVCLMNDGSVQKFTGIRCECADGSINTHIDAFDDNYDDVDNIIFWIEMPYL